MPCTKAVHSKVLHGSGDCSPALPAGLTHLTLNCLRPQLSAA